LKCTEIQPLPTLLQTAIINQRTIKWKKPWVLVLQVLCHTAKNMGGYLTIPVADMVFVGTGMV
jgi:hypothetical protein